ncbi:MAG: YceI family protein [Chitinophagales bacterium]
MKTIILVLGILTTSIAFSQDLYLTKTGEITFFSKTPMEDIEAENNSVTCILKTSEGQVAFKVLMKSFLFEKAAMQQHFNDDYVESDKYPKATYDAQIIDHDKIDFTKDGTYTVKTKGEFSLHGVTNTLEEEGTITIKGKKITINSSFDVELEDYNIAVPNMYLKKISNTINIKVHAELEPYQR